VREKPFAILLLDEIEKAYPQALDLFLQILDEGYVTDGYGEKVSFRNMIIIATSNAERHSSGRWCVKKRRSPRSASKCRPYRLDNLFRLEFLNRFDDIIFFERSIKRNWRLSRAEAEKVR